MAESKINKSSSFDLSSSQVRIYPVQVRRVRWWKPLSGSGINTMAPGRSGNDWHSEPGGAKHPVIAQRKGGTSSNPDLSAKSIYPFISPQLYFTLIPTHQFTVYHHVEFVCFMSSSSYAHAAHDFKTFADNSISCRNLVFLYPVFPHFVSDLRSVQSSASKC